MVFTLSVCFIHGAKLSHSSALVSGQAQVSGLEQLERCKEKPSPRGSPGMSNTMSQDHPLGTEGRWLRPLELVGSGMVLTLELGIEVTPPRTIPAGLSPAALDSRTVPTAGHPDPERQLLVAEELRVEYPHVPYFLASPYVTSGQQNPE